jgi:hypothetical protein
MCMSDYRHGLDWQLDLLTTYSAIAYSHTTAHTVISQFVFSSRFLVTDPSNILFLRSYRLTNMHNVKGMKSAY